MKKFLFVAILAAGSLVACNDTSNTVSPEDSARMADSAAKANGGSMMTTPSDTSGSMMTTPSDTSNKMMGDTSSSMMKSDSMK